jgi:hypothetical protein
MPIGGPVGHEVLRGGRGPSKSLLISLAAPGAPGRSAGPRSLRTSAPRHPLPAAVIHTLLGVPGVSSSPDFAVARGLARQGTLIC